MHQSQLNQLTRAEELFDDGNLEEALEILNDKSHFEGLSPQQKSHFQFLRGLILFYYNQGEDLINLGEKIYEEGQKLNDNLQSFDGLLFLILGLGSARRYEEAINFFKEIDSVIKSFSNLPKEIIIQRKVRLSMAKAYVGLFSGKVDLVDKSLGWILDSQEKFEKSFEIVQVNLFMAAYLMSVKSEFDLCNEHLKKSLSIAKEIKFNHFWIALCQIYFGVYYISIGEMDKSLKYYIKGLELFKKMKNNAYIAFILINISILYSEMGKYELAVEHLEECLNLYEQNPHSLFNIETPLENLTSLAIENGDNERAQKYFHRLEKIYNQKKDSHVELLYYYSKALKLKRSSRIRDKAKAEDLFKEIIETDTIGFDLIIRAYVHLCDILLMEYRIENNIEVFDELNYYISKLSDIAERQHSYLVFCETFILRAKVALINFNMKIARRYLTQAQKIAETYGMKRLAMKISFEHDELLKQLGLWEKLKESGASLTERWTLARLSDQMEKMVKTRMIEVPKLSNEEPVLLLILTEGGSPLLTHSFIDKKSVESHLFGGFLTTIDYFMKEMFSEGLDRAIFGDYTLLMKSIPPFFISYIFKGDSYYALQKVNYFIDHIQIEEVFQNLLKSSEVGQFIHLKDIPLLESLITETFINNNTTDIEL